MKNRLRILCNTYPRAVLLLLVAPLIIWAYLSRAHVDDKFMFAKAATATYGVSEEQEIKENGRAPVMQKLSYQAKMNLKGAGGAAEISFIRQKAGSGNLAFAFFPESLTIAAKAGETPSCPDSATPVFPETLLSAFYHFPAGQLFAGKRWQSSLCRGSLQCFSSVSALQENQAHIKSECTGNVGAMQVFAVSQGVFDQGVSTYVSLDVSFELVSSSASSKRHLVLKAVF